jgi:hypothetical protein
MFNMKNTLGWNRSPAQRDRTRSRVAAARPSSTIRNLGRHRRRKGQLHLRFAERQWFVPFYFDIGTGQSDLTYQIARRHRLQVQMG